MAKKKPTPVAKPQTKKVWIHYDSSYDSKNPVGLFCANPADTPNINTTHDELGQLVVEIEPAIHGWPRDYSFCRDFFTKLGIPPMEENALCEVTLTFAPATPDYSNLKTALLKAAQELK